MEVRIWYMLGIAERQVFRTRGEEEIPEEVWRAGQEYPTENLTVFPPL